MSVIKEIKDQDARTLSAQRSTVFNYLFKNAVADVMVGEWYLFEYDPKFKPFLNHWDKYPLVLVLDIYEDGFLGANFHYTSPKSRMLLAKKFLNKKVSIPMKLIHRYIPKRADNLFFKIPEKELVEFAGLPLEEFRDSKNRFVSAAKIHSSVK